MKVFINSILLSYAQVFFSNRKWFGLLALLTTFLTPHVGMMGLLGVILCNMTAYVFKYDENKINSGIYGFNGLFFGAAAAYYFSIDVRLLFLIPFFIMITFLVNAVIENVFANLFGLPGLSLPFIFVLIMFILFLSNYGVMPASTHVKLFAVNENTLGIFKYYFQAIGLVFLQKEIISGIILAIGLLFFSRVISILSICGFILNYFLLKLILPQSFDSLIVLTSLNAILTSIALGGSLIIPGRKSFLLALFTVPVVIVTTGFLTKLVGNTHLPILVLPFNFVVLSFIYALKFRIDHSGLTLLYFSPGSPEENLYYHENRTERFGSFTQLSPELPVFGEWTVSQGVEGDITHLNEWKYAIDFVITDDTGKQFENEGNLHQDYYCFNLPVSAPLSGEVVKVIDGIPDNPIGEVNLEKNWGNTIIIHHDVNLYSALSHLESGSIKVKEGDTVQRGEVIANCGSSGRSPYPHLHFQFQKTDKLGDKTIKYPFAYFIETSKDASDLLTTYDYPESGSKVKNVELHKTVKKGLDFKLGDQFKFDCSHRGKVFTENWEVKVDIFNQLFIESDRGAKVFVTKTDKVFYLSSFFGETKSALYYFYFAALRVPYCYSNDVRWSDKFPISAGRSSLIKYLSEFTLLFYKAFETKIDYRFAEKYNGNTEVVILGDVEFMGRGIFNSISKSGNSKLMISDRGIIKSISYLEKNNIIFEAKESARE